MMVINRAYYKGANKATGNTTPYDRYPWRFEDIRYVGKEVTFSEVNELYNGRAIQWSPDGGLFFIATRNAYDDELGRIRSGGVLCYRASTPYDVETLTKDYVLFPGDITDMTNAHQATFAAIHGMQIRIDGRKMFLNNRWETYSYELSEPWDISTAVQDGYYDISQDVPFAEDPENPVEGEFATPFTHDLYVTPTGDRIIIDQRPNHLLHQWDMTTPWDITTMQYAGYFDVDFLPSNYGRNPDTADSKIRGVEFAPSLDRFFVFAPDISSVAEYKCKTPGSVIDATLITSDWLAPQLVAQNQSMEFSPDGFRLWITNMTEGTLGDKRPQDDIYRMVTVVREYML